ncbi:MAG: ABC transporter substrate-binding protein [Deltaproteobacteria bacterium]|jgi:NitT/TauT family transport system substrate-binding protein|nr:ABC transporter substrate-binding protein [Deltaproteobacteria bacterium]
MQRYLFEQIVSAAVGMILLVMMAGCAPEAEKPLEEVNYRLKWLYNISVVGDLYALDSGLFTKYGLTVDVKPGGPEKDAIKELELGHAQFGVASADQVIRAVSKGSPIVVIAQLFQINPLHWIFRPDRTPLKTPQDLKGLTIGITHGGNDETIMRALLAKYGIQESDVILFSVRYDYTPFYQGEVDLWPLYRNAQAPIIGAKLQKAGERFDLMDPSKLGIRFVANSVVTTRKMLEERRETVENFIKALLQGWQEALDPANTEKAIALMLKYDKETPEEIVRQQLPATRVLMMPSANFKFGTIDTAAWQQTEEIMLAQKLIPVRVYVEKLLKPIKE